MVNNEKELKKVIEESLKKIHYKVNQDEILSMQERILYNFKDIIDEEGLIIKDDISFAESLKSVNDIVDEKEEEGITQGRKLEKLEIAKRLLDLDYPEEDILNITQLEKEDLEKL